MAEFYVGSTHQKLYFYQIQFQFLGELFVQAEPNGCEQCRSGVKLLWENVRSADNIYWENYLLDVGVCDENAKDPEACKTWFNTWWERLAQMIYGEETVPYVCKEVSHGQCEAPSVFDNRSMKF